MSQDENQPPPSLFAADTLAGLHAAAAELAGPDAEACREIQHAVAAANAGDHARAAAILREALPRTTDLRLLYLGFQFFFRTNDRDEAAHLTRRRLDILAAANQQHTPAAARAWNNLALITFFRGDLDEAEHLFQHALAIDEAAGDTEGIARDLGNLALIPDKRGELDQAEALYHRSLALARSVNALSIIATKLFNLAEIAAHRDNPASAAKLFREAAATYAAMNDPAGQQRCAEMLAVLDPSAMRG